MKEQIISSFVPSVSTTKVAVQTSTRAPVQISPLQKFKSWLVQNGQESLANACSKWVINSTYDSKLNATAVRKVIRANCSHPSFNVKLFFGFDFDIKKTNFEKPILSFFNETSWGAPYNSNWKDTWLETRVYKTVDVLPSEIKSFISQQCAGLKTSVASLNNENVNSTEFTKVVCTKVTQKSLFIRSFTPDAPKPLFIKMHSTKPKYVEDAHKVFAKYRQLFDEDKLSVVDDDVGKLDKVKREMRRLG